MLQLTVAARHAVEDMPDSMLLDHLVAIAIAGHARQIWLEVRTSNQRALDVCIAGSAFAAVGVRKAYPGGAEGGYPVRARMRSR